MAWPDAKKVAEYVRTHGIAQLIAVFARAAEFEGLGLLWGDEIEYMVVKLDEEKRLAHLSLRSSEILTDFEAANARGEIKEDVIWHPEYASYMVESTPRTPFSASLLDFMAVEKNMAARRVAIHRFLQPGEHVFSIVNFPRLGCPPFTLPPAMPDPTGRVSQSLFLPDEMINHHPRFPALTANIRQRRGSKVAINVPIFRDERTPRPFREEFAAPAPDAKEDHIYLDAMGFGMGCCCLQVTFQASSINEARYLYDQLAVITPVFLALSAGSPIFRGFLADVDCRWNVISGSVDDRTPGERGLAPLQPGERVIRKSRYDSIDSYLGGSAHFKDSYNDLAMEVDEEIAARLTANGFDPPMARHFAHLFIRDPLVIYKSLLEQDDSKSTLHFENLQSTNWQTMRFKPPPPDSKIGWRVEFRPTEVQMTDYENAAYVVFVVLLTRAILSTNLNLYIPLSKVDLNMQTAQQRDAVTKGAFFFRKDPCGCLPDTCGDDHAAEHEFGLMSLDDIINGKPGVFIGLIPIVRTYLAEINADPRALYVIDRYLTLISKRARGEVQTSAAWMRDFVTHHPDYKQDSVVSDTIAYDLLSRVNDIAAGRLHDERLLGPKIECA